MADKQSREGKNIVWKCLECGARHIFHKNDYGQDGLRCHNCNGIVDMDGFTDEPPTTKYKRGVDHAASGGDLTVRIDIDCSDALTGLKAIQREARKATQTLRELEETLETVDLYADGKKVAEFINPHYCKGCNRHNQYCVCAGEPNE